MAVSKRTRYEVLKRDNFTCRYCRETEGKIVVDHVVPVALGGSDDPDNLVAACHDCNAGKASTSPTAASIEDAKSSDAKWADALKRAAAVRADQRELFVEYLNIFIGSWPGWMPNNYESSIEALYNAGLPEEELRDAINVALSARGVESRFRYFCGVGWRKVRDLQEIAKALLEVEEAANGAN